jgi:hypothetical protein
VAEALELKAGGNVTIEIRSIEKIDLRYSLNDRDYMYIDNHYYYIFYNRC